MFALDKYIYSRIVIIVLVADHLGFCRIFYLLEHFLFFLLFNNVFITMFCVFSPLLFLLLIKKQLKINENALKLLCVWRVPKVIRLFGDYIPIWSALENAVLFKRVTSTWVDHIMVLLISLSGEDGQMRPTERARKIR